jgi:hypothetical protein
MTQYRIRVYTSRNYGGYFWDVEEYRQPDKKREGYWYSLRGGYAFTRWGAGLAAKRSARRYLAYRPFETIEELK